MVELLLSMAILSLMIVGLADLFSFTASTWSGQMRLSADSGHLKEAASLLRADLESAFPNRPLPHQTIDPGELTNDAQRRWLANKMLLPFEIDRRSGLGLERSFQNAETSRRFSQMAFVAIQPGAGSLLPENFTRERHGPLADPALPPGGRPTPSDVSVIGYYVAYTPDSLVGGNDRWSMKLYRHFRPGGTSLGQAQASSTVRSVTATVNHDLVPRRKFRNSELPFLLAFHAKDLDLGGIEHTPSQPPWPASLPALGRPMPDRSKAAYWFSPNHPVHDVLPGDPAVIDHVVGFSANPYKRVLNGDNPVVLGAADLAKHLGFTGDEWPVLVLPDFIDLELAVIDGSTAALLTKREDWLADWQRPPASGESSAARLIRKSVTSLRFRVTLRAVPDTVVSS